METQRQGQRLYWETMGERQAPPLLMIRGLARTARHWGPVLELLARRFFVVVFDNRGVGRSGVPRLPFTTRDMAADAVAVLDAAGVARAQIFGMSLGGMIAQQLALRYPRRVERLVLGCTRAGPGPGTISPSTVLGLLAAMRAGGVEGLRRSHRLVVSDAFAQRHPEVLQRWEQLARDEPPSPRGVLLQLAAAARHDARRQLPRLAVPTLCVTGTVDRLIHPRASEELAALIPQARLARLGGAGHDFSTEQPEATAALLERFLLG